MNHPKINNLFKDAYKAGQEDFKDGKKAVPAMSRKCMNLLDDSSDLAQSLQDDLSIPELKHMLSMGVMTYWSRGWTAENLKPSAPASKDGDLADNGPKPKFSWGDKVETEHGGQWKYYGQIENSLKYDDFVGTWTYYVRLEDGRRVTTNGNSLRLAKLA